jgi:serine/threonine protein kinase
MLTGERPFAGENSQVVFMKILAADGLSVRYVDPALPKAVDDLIYTATRKKVEDRYESATAFRQALDRLSLAKMPKEEQEEPVPSTKVDPPKVFEEVSQERLDELKKRFHELAVLHRGNKPKADRRRTIPDIRAAHDSEIPISYEPSEEAADRAPPDVEDQTEKRERVPRLSGDEDVEGTAPTKPGRHRA